MYISLDIRIFASILFLSPLAWATDYPFHPQILFKKSSTFLKRPDLFDGSGRLNDYVVMERPRRSGPPQWKVLATGVPTAKRNAMWMYKRSPDFDFMKRNAMWPYKRSPSFELLKRNQMWPYKRSPDFDFQFMKKNSFPHDHLMKRNAAEDEDYLNEMKKSDVVLRFGKRSFEGIEPEDADEWAAGTALRFGKRSADTVLRFGKKSDTALSAEPMSLDLEENDGLPIPVKKDPTDQPTAQTPPFVSGKKITRLPSAQTDTI